MPDRLRNACWSGQGCTRDLVSCWYSARARASLSVGSFLYSYSLQDLARCTPPGSSWGNRRAAVSFQGGGGQTQFESFRTPPSLQSTDSSGRAIGAYKAPHEVVQPGPSLTYNTTGNQRHWRGRYGGRFCVINFVSQAESLPPKHIKLWSMWRGTTAFKHNVKGLLCRLPLHPGT